MKIAILLLPAVTALIGCVNPQRFAMSPVEQQRLMQEAAEQRHAVDANFHSYVNACLDQFPHASRDAKNDGNKRMSEYGAVNVSLTTEGRDIVCSVNISNMQVERVFQNGQIFPLENYKAYAARNPVNAIIATPEVIEPDPPESDLRLSYKGVRVGDSLARFKAKLPLYACRDSYCTYSQDICTGSYSDAPRASIKECIAGTSYGGANVLNGGVFFIDGKVSSILLTLDGVAIPLLNTTLTEKYGKANSIDNAPFMNKLGTNFPNTKRTWLIEGEKLVTTLRSDTLEKGSVSIHGKAAQKNQQDAAERQIQRHKQDF